MRGSCRVVGAWWQARVALFCGQSIADSSVRERGFTLLEVLVVIAILSLAALTVPASLSSWHARTELRKTELALDRLLDCARQEALRGHRAMSVQFDTRGDRIGIPALDLWHKIRGEQKVTILGMAEGVRREAPAIVFLSDGYSTGGSITIEQGGMKVSRRIGWLSRRVDHGQQ